MQERAEGIILRTHPLTETSLIVHWLTTEQGRLSTVAKGARRPKSPFTGKLDLFYAATFTYQPSRRSDLHTLREVSVHERHLHLRSHTGRLQQACYFVQLLEQATESNTPLPGLLPILLGALALSEGNEAQPLLVLAFETKLLAYLGLTPGTNESTLSAGAREILGLLLDADWPVLGRLRGSVAQVSELTRFLGRFLIDQFGRVAKGRSSCFEPDWKSR